MTNRKQFIKDFFNFLLDKDYIVLKYIEDSIDSIGDYSDIDLAVKKDLSNQIMDYVNKYENILNYEKYSYTFMDMTYIVFNDNTFIELDLINGLMRKSISYLDIDEVLDNVYINNENIKVSTLEYNFLSIFLFYLLNKTDIDIKYKNYFTSLSIEEQEKILDFINKRYNINIKKFIDLCTYDENIYLHVKKSINKLNGILSKIKNTILYPKNLYVNFTKSKIITFSGVDGAGKTTVLREFTEVLEKKYRRDVVELRHRPSVLPILSAIKHGRKEAEKKTMKVLPRTGSNKSKISSYIRFFYYLTDYILGQWIVRAKYSLGGNIIVYDRYYFDFINDARRTNINLNSNFIKFFYKFVFKPDINIFLFASPEVILSRKQEMDKESIVDLTKKYKTLFDELAEKNMEQYMSIENINKEVTMKTIEDTYVKVSL